MHPLNNGSQVENVPALKPRVGTAGYFSESNDNGAPSYPGQDWFNAVIREFQNALSTSGVSFDPDRFDHLQKMITNASNGVRNLFEANQNFNVEGADGMLTSTNQTFTDGQEFSHGWTVTGGTNLVDVKLVNGEVTATSGKIQRAYDKDPAGLITAASIYGSVTAKNGTQTYADTLTTNGIEVTESASKVYLTIDFGVYVGGVSVAILSAQRGRALAISNDESSYNALGVGDYNFGSNGYLFLKNGFVLQWVSSAQTGVTTSWPIPFPNNVFSWSVTGRSSSPSNTYVGSMRVDLLSNTSFVVQNEAAGTNSTVFAIGN
ncbi:hypothetical protein VPQG_00047 [Vibrio phage VBpm10]|nr:hypothetical protein VPQG_00047 [Vibrio phage VBpm10]